MGWWRQNSPSSKRATNNITQVNYSQSSNSGWPALLMKKQNKDEMHKYLSKKGEKKQHLSILLQISQVWKAWGGLKVKNSRGCSSSCSRPGCVSRVSCAQPRAGELSCLSKGTKLLLEEPKTGCWTVHCQWSALGKLLCPQKEPWECLEVIQTWRRVNSTGLLPLCLSHQGR